MSRCIIFCIALQFQARRYGLIPWYPLLAPGGLFLRDGGSQVAMQFDATGEGVVHRAFHEWRAANPAVEAIMLNGESHTMEGTRPLYKDACGLAILHNPAMPGAI